MILIENAQIIGWEPTIRGMRNPMNSWAKSDSAFIFPGDKEWHDVEGNYFNLPPEFDAHTPDMDIGPRDLDLMLRLAKAGPVHGKFRRMIVVYIDITAPLYWWKEFDTYRVGVTPNPNDIEMNSCSTMHKIHAKEFTLEDFSHEHLFNGNNSDDGDALYLGGTGCSIKVDGENLLNLTINVLNYYRKRFLATNDKDYWWQMIQLLPSSYNQKRTVMLNYEVLANMYQNRHDHKQDEWRELCRWIEGLPYSEIITCNATEKKEG